MKVRNRRRERRIANAVIADPEQHTTMNREGSVRSVQAANVTLSDRELEAIWTPMHLERLARTYWKYLSRVTLGLIRVEYSADERAVVLIARPFVLLRFRPPEYEMGADRGVVRWTIRDGVLVAQPGRSGAGYLEIDVQRCPADEPGYARVHVEVEIANFYPAIATWVARWFYSATQSRIHVLVTHGFLRSLARLDLEESEVGRFADRADGKPVPEHRGDAVNVGDTPWLVWAGIAASTALVSSAAYLRFATPPRRTRRGRALKRLRPQRR